MSNPDYTTKTCSKCGNTYPATTEYWHRQADRLHSWCKACAQEYNRRYREENRDKVLGYQKRYYEENSEKAREYRKRYYEENHDKVLEGKKRYREENPEYQKRYYEENRDKLLEGNRRYREENRDKVQEYKKRYREENLEKVQEYQKRYREENPEKKRARDRNRRARLRNAEGTHTAADIQEHVKGQTDSKGRLRCWWCGKVIKDAYHVDHVIPLVKGGSNGTSNLCISCPVCNLSKNDKLPGEWSGRLM